MYQRRRWVRTEKQRLGRGEREKGVLGKTEKETWEGREREEFEIFLEMARCFHAGAEIF